MNCKCVSIQDLECTRLRLDELQTFSWAFCKVNKKVLPNFVKSRLLYLHQGDHDEYSRNYLLNKLPRELYESTMDFVLEPSKFCLALKNVPAIAFKLFRYGDLFLEIKCQDLKLCQLDESIRNLFKESQFANFEGLFKSGFIRCTLPNLNNFSTFVIDKEQCLVDGDVKLLDKPVILREVHIECKEIVFQNNVTSLKLVCRFIKI